MLTKRFFRILLILSVIVLVQAACEIPFSITMKNHAETTSPAEEANPPGGQPADQTTGEPAALPVPSGPPLPTPFVYHGPLPSAGTGGVYGRMLWNSKPVEGLEVKLCDEIKYFGGCEGAEFPTTTGADGVYAILNVPPGTYGLTYRAVDSDTWYFITSGILDAKDFEVPADKMVDVGDFYTVRTDLVILTPQEDERMSIARPTLSWQPYPEAAYYELTFHSGRAGSMIHRKKLTETSFVLDSDLQTCDYSFDVEVFNAQEQVIAEYDGWRNFEVAGMPTSCVMVALTPADGATVGAAGITLTWEPHALAKTYKLHMYLKSDSAKKVLDFVETREASYTITQNVPAGEYNWVVYGYDEFGDGLGFTDAFVLYVTNP